MSTTRSTASGRAAEPADPVTSGERGTGLVGTLVGFSIFVVLLLFATQVLVRLYATSTLTSAANRAAQEVAEAPVPAAEVPAAQATAVSSLGTFGARRTAFIWKEVDGQQVVLEVRGRSPELLPWPGGWSPIVRTVTVRTERFR